MLATSTPIMAHVAGRLWLDGPLLAFSTAGAAAFLLSTRRRSTALACAAGVLLGYASLIKVTAFLVLPGVAALAWSIAPRSQYGELLRRGILLLAIATAVQLPWELWQWAVVGSPFPVWAGRPAESLVRSNPYVHYVTVVRSPWTYTVLLPRVIWTLLPALVLLAVLRRESALARRGGALLLWITCVVGAHVALGAIGYAKLLRLVILVTPATTVLFALLVGGAVGRVGDAGAGRRLASIALLLFALAGLVVEVAQGLKTSMYHNRSSDLIVPLTGIPR
jgi:4-amino-4-deoxy-L-arabinose transferase-like glycosyltransferase